ncbi:HAMP domain-containing histidine kinase [Luteolibacter yonseiensis]|uniref:histidine kinase n=1 Tax=Luteolibacter yonseiensis TaxID=1144680 RepID=A0A934QYG5_9BACT|nr:HAMP domain-containing sensor histidine kinase [Luteolibacter yonseiensis]MBK1815013.1 HAMP domain-containing histidine kinase [Luteolibacter yonseiensis]
MMRPALLTILPMLAAAVLVMVGGERMARREVETRTPADRTRLLDFADSFRRELVRLESLYLDHMEDLAYRSPYAKQEDATAAAAEISGIRLIRVFRQKGNDLTISPPFNPGRLPEIELEKRKRPFDPENAVVLGAALLEKDLPKNGSWLASPVPSLQVHCRQPEPGVLVAFLIDMAQVRERASGHVASWLEEPLAPLREAGERVQIELADGRALAKVGSDRHGPAASIIPIRTLFGDWQIRTWDGLVVSRTYDPATLATAVVLAIVLLASGGVLFIQQKRALRLASERVSFVNRVSHELGTPLTNLTLNLDLATEVLTSRPAEARRRLGLVAEEIERLSRLVANVLTFSRRERDTLELKPVRCMPGEIIGRTLESFRPALERRGIVIEARISADNPALLDADALSQITGNLLSNVEKYATAGRWLGLEAVQDGGLLTLEVRDHGPGIPAVSRQRIFKPFERVLQTTNEGASGTGLGLAIGQDLAGRMGGTLELMETGQGAAFRLRIPAPPALAIVTDTDAA